MTKLSFAVFIMMVFSPAVISAAELIVKVTDEGEPVANAEILLLDSQTRGLINSNFTNNKGIYQYTVKEGQYDLRVIKETFSDVSIKNIEVTNADVKKNVKLVPRAFASDEKEAQPEDDCE